MQVKRLRRNNVLKSCLHLKMLFFVSSIESCNMHPSEFI